MDKIKGDNLLKWAGWTWDGPNPDELNSDKLYFGFWYSPEGDQLRLGEDPDLNSLDLLLSIVEIKCKKYTLIKLEGEYTAVLDGRQQDAAKYESSLVLALQAALLRMMDRGENKTKRTHEVKDTNK